MTSALTPAALAEIRERDAKTDPELFEYDNIVGIVGTIGMPKLVSAVRDRRALLADYGEREKRTAGLVHELLECQAEVSRLTAELAAARKPQELPKPTDDDIFEAWCDDANAALVRKEDAGEPNIAAAGFRAGFMAGHGFALESLGAQDGGERKASTCSRWVHGDCMCVKPPGHDGRCDCACYVTEDQS